MYIRCEFIYNLWNNELLNLEDDQDQEDLVVITHCVGQISDASICQDKKLRYFSLVWEWFLSTGQTSMVVIQPQYNALHTIVRNEDF